MAKQAVEEKPKDALVVQNLHALTEAPNEAELFGGDGPTGLENVTSKDVLIPRITILQGLSPQLNKAKAEYIPNAKLGQFCDTALGQVYDELLVIPVYYGMMYLEWAPRETKKGLVANHGLSSKILEKCTRNEKRQWITPEGNLLAETATFYCLNMNARGRPSFIPLSSTQLRAAKTWITKIKDERVKRPDGSEFCPKIFYRAWHATTVAQSNNSGDWAGWRFEPGPKLTEIEDWRKILTVCEAFIKEINEGLVRGDFSDMEEEEGAHAADEKAAF